MKDDRVQQFDAQGFPVQTCGEHHDTGRPCYSCWLEGMRYEHERVMDAVDDWYRHGYPIASLYDTLANGGHK